MSAPAGETPAITGPADARHPQRLGEPLGPVPRLGPRAFLGLDRIDIGWLVLLVGVAFALRVFSPIFPNFLSNPTSAPPVTATGLGEPYNAGGCTDAPVGPDGQLLPPTTQSPDASGHPVTVTTPDQKHCGFVFDEVYFPVDAAYDARSVEKDYFDPEPPLTKLTMAPAIRLLGFGTWSWRITSAITGSLLVGLVYLIARRLRRERFFAIAAAIIVSLDGLEFVESRIGVIDIIAVFFAFLAFYVFLLHWGARTHAQWRATLYLFGAVLGLGFGAKLTAIGPAVVGIALVLVRLFEPGLLSLVGRSRTRRGAASGEAAMWRDAAGGIPRALLHYVAAGVVSLVVFTACYSHYLTVDHTLDNFAACTPTNGLTLDTNAPTDGSSVPGTTLYRAPRFDQSGSLVQRLLWFPTDIVRDVKGQVLVSLKYHSTECRGHPYASRWYTWPVLAHPVLFYVGSPTSPTGQADSSIITNVGNPAVWWPALPALLFCCIAMTTGRNWVLRLAPLALLSVSLALMISSFHNAETQASISTAVHPSSLFIVGLTGMLLFGALTLYCAVALRRTVPALIVLGFLCAWMIPWVPGNEQRVLFLYHMLGALPFMALGLAYALSALRATVVRVGTARIPLRPLAYAGLGVVIAGFVFFYPIWTAAPQSNADHALRMWFESWVQGWN